MVEFNCETQVSALKKLCPSFSLTWKTGKLMWSPTF